MTLTEFLNKFIPMLLAHDLDRIEKDLDIGKVTAYWAGTIIRIDLKPRNG
jgi:hypothetical protein